MLKSAWVALAAFLFIWTSLLAATPIPVAATAEGAPTRSDVVEIVDKAVEFYRQNGREKTIAELNRHDGAFARGMDYVDLHDMN